MADENPDAQHMPTGDAPTVPHSTDTTSDGALPKLMTAAASDETRSQDNVRASEFLASYYKTSIHNPIRGPIRVSQKMANNKYFKMFLSLPPGSYVIVEARKWEAGRDISRLREIIEVETRLANGDILPFNHDSKPPLRKNEPLPENYNSTLLSVRVAGFNISTHIIDFIESNMKSWSKEEVLDFKRLQLYKRGPTWDPEISFPSCKAFLTITRKAKEMGLTMNDDLAREFIDAIERWRELREWYDRLPADDERAKKNARHEEFLRMLVKMAGILIGAGVEG
jgi:hypothetical protein